MKCLIPLYVITYNYITRIDGDGLIDECILIKGTRNFMINNDLDGDWIGIIKFKWTGHCLETTSNHATSKTTDQLNAAIFGQEMT